MCMQLCWSNILRLFQQARRQRKTKQNGAMTNLMITCQQKTKIWIELPYWKKNGNKVNGNNCGNKVNKVKLDVSKYS